MDVKLPDGRIVHNVPEGTTRTQLMARLAKGGHQVVEPKFGFKEAVTHGATLGLDSYADGVAGTLINAAVAPFSKSVDFDPAGAFEKERRGNIARYQKWSGEHPVANIGAGVLGAFAGPAKIAGEALRGVTTLGGRMIGAAKTAAPMAGVNAATNSANYSDMPLNATVGAAAGGVFGGLLPLGFAGARALGGGAYNMVAPLWNGGKGVAIKKIADTLVSDNVTPSAAGAAMDQARKRGVPLMLADTGENLRRLTGSVARQPGPARTMVRAALTDRQMGQQGRLQNAITRDLGPVGNVNQLSDKLIEKAKVAAAPLYEKFRAAPVVSSPEIDSLLATPAGKAALSRARTIAANERQNPEAMGFALDGEGNVVLNPVAADAHSAYATAKAAHDQAAQALQSAQKLVAGGGGAPGAVGIAQRNAQAAQDALEKARQALSAAPSDGTAKSVAGYTPQTLDYVKRGLDDVVEQYRDPVTRRLNLDEAGRAVNDVRANFLKEVDAVNPHYAAARQAYAGPAGERDALQLGKTMVGKSEGDIARATANMSDSQREQFSLGMRSQLSDNLSRRTDMGDKVGSLYNSPQRRSVLQQASGPGANHENFANTLADEASAGETYRVAMTGSPTAINLADDAMVGDSGLLNATGRAISGAKSGGIGGALANLVTPGIDALRFGVGKSGQRVRNDLASYLTETDPAAFQAAMKALQEDLGRKYLRRGIFGYGAPRAAGTLTGQFAAPPQQ